MRSVRLVSLLLTLTIAGCAASSSPSPAASPSAAVPSASPVAAPSSASPAPSAAAAATPVPTPAPSTIRLQDWTATELFLLAGAEPSLRPTCGKAPKLPEGAYDGIQCHPAGISSVGFYAFDQREDARKLYFDRLAEYKVKPDSGIGCPGEGVDTPGNDGYDCALAAMSTRTVWPMPGCCSPVKPAGRVCTSARSARTATPTI